MTEPTPGGNFRGPGSRYGESFNQKEDVDVAQHLLPMSALSPTHVSSASVEIRPAEQISGPNKKRSSIKKPVSWHSKQTLVVIGCLFLIALLLAVVFFVVTLHQASASVPQLADGLVVTETLCGQVQGLEQDGGFSFYGVPYAVPPEGDFRFARTVPLEKMEDCWTGTYIAHYRKPYCYQHRITGQKRLTMSEDCLYLDIFTPEVSYRKPRPVVVYFPGETFLGHDEVTVRLGPSAGLARQTDIVFVRVEYRLSAFGFMALRALRKGPWPSTSGNSGIHDMMAALKWIEANIDNFGGNPRDVTVVGHGSSATAILGLISSKKSQGFFNKAWIIDGSARFLNVTLREAEETNKEFLRRIGCKDVQCLFYKDSYEILDAVPWTNKPLDLPYSNESNNAIAVIDGELIQDLPLKSFQSGTFTDVSVVMGVSPYDSFHIREINNDSLITPWVETMLGNFSKELAAGAIAKYSKPPQEMTFTQYVNMVNDLRVVCPLLHLAEQLQSAFLNPVSTYVVTYVPERSRLNLGHRLDVAAIFQQVSDLLPNATASDLAFERTIQDMFNRFVKHTVLGVSGRIAVPGYIDVIGRHAVRRKDAYPNCDFWLASGLYPEHEKYN